MTKKELFNEALSKVTKRRIVSVDEMSDEAKACRELYESALRDVLFEHPFSCAVNVVGLNQLAGDPPHGFANRFALPADYIRTIMAFYDSTRDSFDFQWEMRPRELWTDASTVYLMYVQLVDAVDTMTPPLTMTLTQRLGIKLAYPMATDPDREAQLLEQYERLILPRAKSLDSMESRSIYYEESPWVEAMERGSI